MKTAAALQDETTHRETRIHRQSRKTQYATGDQETGPVESRKGWKAVLQGEKQYRERRKCAHLKSEYFSRAAVTVKQRLSFHTKTHTKAKELKITMAVKLKYFSVHQNIRESWSPLPICNGHVMCSLRQKLLQREQP